MDRSDQHAASSAGQRMLPALTLVVVAGLSAAWTVHRFTSPEAVAMVRSGPLPPASALPSVSAGPQPSGQAAPPRLGGPGNAGVPKPLERRPLAPASSTPKRAENNEAKTIVVPPLVELTESEAVKALEARGWSGKLEIENVPTYDPDMVDKILEQDPQPDARIGRDESIQVRICIHAEPSDPAPTSESPDPEESYPGG